MLVGGLGFGGRGAGSGESGTGLPVPARPRDEKQLTFVMMQPEAGDAKSPMRFRLKDDDPSPKTYSIDETIARVKSGGRFDMILMTRGTVRAGSADDALELFKRAGIQSWKGTAAVPAVSGNARGHYGRTT
jgi:hypothetical protein